MKRNLVFILLTALATVTGCQKQSVGAAAPATSRPVATTEIDPLFENYNITRVGILDLANTSSNEDAAAMKAMVEGALMRSGTYEFAKSSSFSRDAARSGVEADFGRLQNTWDKALKMDDATLKAVCEATGKDAVLAYEVPQWDEMKIDSYTTGTSKTSVKLRMVLYAADGTLLWDEADQKVEESTYYDPSLYVKSTQSGQAIYDESKVPEAPPIKPVALELAEELVKQLPKIKTKDAEAEPVPEPEPSGGW